MVVKRIERERESQREVFKRELQHAKEKEREKEKVLFLAPVFPLFCKLTDCQCLRHLACTCPALPEQLHGLIMSPKSVPKQNRHCMGSLLLLLFTFEDENDLENSGEEYDASSSRRGNEEGGEGGGSGSGRMRIGRRPRLLHSSMNAPQERNTAKRTCPGLMKSMWKFVARRERGICNDFFSQQRGLTFARVRGVVVDASYQSAYESNSCITAFT